LYDFSCKGGCVKKTFNAVYKDGVLVPLQDPGLPEQETVRLQIVPASVQITAAVARHKVNRFILDNVSYLMGAGQPALVEGERLVWHVPVMLTYPDRGVVGLVGFLDVDAESGDLLVAADTVVELTRHAHAIASAS
jgi:predicted DNA-binding antitoxin AbrB/MazE fold protein